MLIVKMFEKGMIFFSEIMFLILGVAALSLLVVIGREEGVIGVWNTLRVDVLGMLVRFITVLVIFFTIAGSLNHLQRRHSERFKNIISGNEGTTKMLALAATLPGPAGGKQLKDAWEDPTSNKTKVMLCLVAMMALGVNSLVFRAKVLGGPLTMIWIFTAFMLLFQVWIVCKLKPWVWFAKTSIIIGNWFG